MAIKFINYFKKSVKWIALFLFLSFLFIIILDRLGNGFKNKIIPAISDYRVKGKKVFGRALKANGHYSKNNLKDIFNLPGKKYKKFNRLFIVPAKTDNNGMKAFMRGAVGEPSNNGQSGGGTLPNFIKNLKFKGFSKKRPSPPSLIFISGKTALLKIDGRNYYVHAGENIKGMFILKIGLTGVSYSDKGKIKYLSF